MPPRYAYWTILIDNKPTAFRAREQEELLPTLAQLRRTNSDVVMKWFARGRLWDSPEAEREAQRRPPVTGEKRGGDWRPGGAHKDPRDRFKKKNRPEHAWSDKDASVRRDRDKLGPPGDRGRGAISPPAPPVSPRVAQQARRALPLEQKPAGRPGRSGTGPGVPAGRQPAPRPAGGIPAMDQQTAIRRTTRRPAMEQQTAIGRTTRRPGHGAKPAPGAPRRPALDATNPGGSRRAAETVAR